MPLNKEQMLAIVQSNIKKLEDKTFNVFFYVLDTKGTPAGFMEYVYQTALTLKNMGYNVVMLHNEKEFQGVGEWMGEEYANLPHKNVEQENVEINASDFLFIPELLSNVIVKTKKLPCKRVMILQNRDFMTEMMPVSATPGELGITDAIVTTNAMERYLLAMFPDMRTHIVPPAINDVYKKGTEPQKLVVNIVAKNQSDVNRIIKPFYWRHPMYRWVSFRELRGLSIETFSEALKEAAITICIDDDTAFGYTILESLRSGSLTIAKMPSHLSDWMVEDGKLTDSCLWFNDIDDVPDNIANIVRTWTNDAVPKEIYDAQSKLDNTYTVKGQEESIKKVYVDGLFKKRLDEFKEVEQDVKNNVLKVDKED